MNDDFISEDVFAQMVPTLYKLFNFSEIKNLVDMWKKHVDKTGDATIHSLGKIARMNGDKITPASFRDAIKQMVSKKVIDQKYMYEYNQMSFSDYCKL